MYIDLPLTFLIFDKQPHIRIYLTDVLRFPPNNIMIQSLLPRGVLNRTNLSTLSKILSYIKVTNWACVIM